MKYYTHSGFFHADEVAGYAICRLAGVCDQLVRLTDLSSIPSNGIVADIGRDWSPIFWWTEKQCERYIKGDDLPGNKVKDTICISGECLCWAFAGRGRTSRD